MDGVGSLGGSMRQAIEDYRNERDIPYLIHFTRAENLPSIMANGLVPRAQIDSGEVHGWTNDQSRLDARRDYNCLSIAFPNAPMFYRFKQDNPNVEWPMLVIDPVLMAQRPTLFCWKNAAGNEFSKEPDETLSSLDAFKGLYEEREVTPTRSEQYLKKCDPTNVQSEVLINGVIPPEYIFRVIFPSYPCQQRFAPTIGSRESAISNRRGFYGNRQYFRQWGEGK